MSATFHKFPNPVVKNMYLEITNIAQGMNIAILIQRVADNLIPFKFSPEYISFLILSISSLLIIVIFWIRYYLDTEILNCSFTISSAIWFFAYVASQGLSASFVSSPGWWFVTTGAFLFFGAGFYWFNLQEIKRKNNRKRYWLPKTYKQWQTKRMIDLMVLCILSFIGAMIVHQKQELILFASLLTLPVAVWQMILTNDYRKQKMIASGL